MVTPHISPFLRGTSASSSITCLYSQEVTALWDLKGHNQSRVYTPIVATAISFRKDRRVVVCMMVTLPRVEPEGIQTHPFPRAVADLHLHTARVEHPVTEVLEG